MTETPCRTESGGRPGRGGKGRDVVPVEGTIGPGAQVLVTVEREGGVDAPTTAPVVASQPV